MNILHLRLKLLLTLSLVFVTSISAAPFEVDGLSYEIIKGNEVKVVKDRNKNYKNYKGDIVIPSDIEHNGISYKVTCIDNAAFLECFILKSIIIPNSVTRIGAGCFQRCESLESVKLPDNLLEIGNGAFEKCYSLTSIVIPNSVTNIGSNTFSECNRLSEVIIGTSVSSIGDGIFKGCSNLTSISIPKSVELLSMTAFEDCIMNSITIEDGCESLGISNSKNQPFVKELYLGRNVKDGSGRCFVNIELERVTIGSSVTEIADDCFYHAGNFDIVTIPSSVEIIKESAFEGCKIKKLIIGKNVKEIGNFAFTTHISDVTSLNPIPPKVQRNTFVDDFSSVLRVPKGSVDAYKNEKFWKFSKKVEIDSEDDIDEIEIPEEHIKGDINGDGNVDSADINEIEEYIMGNPSPYFDLKIADVNNDGVVNVADIVCITKDKYCKYLTFVAIDDGKFKLSGNSVQYSMDSGITWSTLASDSYSPIVYAGQKIMWKGNITPSTSRSPYGIGTFSSTGRFNVEGNAMSLLYGDNYATVYSVGSHSFFSMFNGCTGLISAENLVLPATTLGEYCYQNMFQNCTSLIKAPSTLPATTLAFACYRQMFYGCASLTTAPSALPATTLTQNCYYYMFNGCTSLTTAPAINATTAAITSCYAMFGDCTSLTTAPVLPATTLGNWCYRNMFENCTSLVTVPDNMLPATTLANSCYNSMFNGCTSLRAAPSLPATTLAEYCYMEMFNGCTSQTTTPSTLPATTLAEYCYSAMFQGCTSLATAPELPATTLAECCYYNMFSRCSRLNYIKCLATNNSANNCTYNWVNGVSSSGTFVKASSMSSWTRGAGGIPTNWTIQEDDGKVDMSGKYLTFVAIDSGTFKFSGNSVSYSLDNGNTWTTLTSDTNSPTVQSGKKIMWRGNLSPTSNGIGTFSSTGRFNVEGNAMSLLYGDGFIAKTSLAGKTSAFIRLFNGCTGLTSAEKLVLPATTLAESCYYGMFNGCTGLTTAPSLPATTLASRCYAEMFNGCTSLATAPSLPATTSTKLCYYAMFKGCTSLTSVPSTLPATRLAESCYHEMFSNCTSLTTVPSDLLPATSLAEDCYTLMFSYCNSLTTAPSLPATTLADYCYYGLFYGCTSLTTVPFTLPATRLAEGCYADMFASCTSLTIAPHLPAKTLAKQCYLGMFSICSSLEIAPDLPAERLTEGCYQSMFWACERLRYIECLATNISATDCTTSWVNNVSSNGTFVKDSSMIGWTRGESGIPSGWTVKNE